MLAWWLAGGWVTAGAAWGDEPAATAAAYRAVLERNLVHAREWLEQRDPKSLAQSAATLQFLAELYANLGDDPAWRAATRELVGGVQELVRSAGTGDLPRCSAALERVEKALAASRGVQPQGARVSLASAPALRRLMLVLDAVQADAKLAVLTGQVAAAKNQAVVLSELGRLVSNARQDAAFTAHSRAFVQAAEALAQASESDQARARQLLRGLSQRCDACHEGLRD